MTDIERDVQNQCNAVRKELTERGWRVFGAGVFAGGALIGISVLHSNNEVETWGAMISRARATADTFEEAFNAAFAQHPEWVRA